MDEFADLRKRCPVLNQIFVPDKIWKDFRKKYSAQPDMARHQSILLTAFSNGVLNKITTPIHHFLFDGSDPKINLDKQYKKDLVEKWMFEQEVIERHKKARIFQGKLTELICATWIDAQGWKIDTLEALGGHFDIDAISPDNVPCAIEVKFVGQEDVSFGNVVQSIESGKPLAGCCNIYDGYNFFLFKAYEAAKQLLSNTIKRSLAFVIISNMAFDLDTSISVIGLDRRPFRLIEDASEKWQSFLNLKKMENRFKNIDRDLDDTIGRINELWIIKQGNYFDYSLNKKLIF